MTVGLGTKARAAFRVAPTNGIDINDADYVFPASVADATTYNLGVLGGYDMIPFTSESLSIPGDYDPDNTLEGDAAIQNLERLSLKPAGAVSCNGKYSGLDSLIACAMGFEKPDVNDSPVAQSSDSLTAGTCATGTFVNDSAVFAAGDVGKFIVITSGTGMHQVRRIDAYNSTTSVDITPNWTTTPTAADTAVMSDVWTHTFEISRQLSGQLFTDIFSSYVTTGILNATDKIYRMGTLGFQKQVTDIVYRGVMINTMTVDITSPAVATFNFDVVAFDKVTGSYHSNEWEYSNSSSAPTNKQIVFKDAEFLVAAFSSSVALDSDDKKCLSGFNLTLNNNLTVDDQDFCSGVYIIEPTRSGQKEINGSITFPKYNSTDYEGFIDDETELMGKLTLTGSVISGTETFELIFWFPRFRLVSGQPNIGGAGKLTATYNMQLLQQITAAAGFPTQNLDYKGEMIVQTTGINPFNVFLNQNKEY